MDNKELRRLNLLGLCSEHGRDDVAKKCGYSDTVYLNQLVNANVSRTQVGDKTARKIEEAFDLRAGVVPRRSVASLTASRPSTFTSRILLNGRAMRQPSC